jgi:hypothetical protein
MAERIDQFTACGEEVSSRLPVYTLKMVPKPHTRDALPDGDRLTLVGEH